MSCRDKKKDLIESIATANIYTTGDNPADHKVAAQWKNYKKLGQIFSEAEVIQLCEDSNPIIRTYAFRQLVETKYKNVYDILINHLSDTSVFTTIDGCVISEESVSDIYLELVKYDLLYNISIGIAEWRDVSFEKRQYDFIDSVLLFGEEIKERTPSGVLKYGSRELLLYRLAPLAKYHERVAQIAKEGVYEVLPVLAQYKSLSDTAFLKKLLSSDSDVKRPLVNHTTPKASIRNAITFFPHPCFYPILKQKALDDIESNSNPDYYEVSPLYFAIVQYPTKETRALLEKALKKLDVGHYRRSGFIYKAVERYPSKEFDGLVKDVLNTSGSW